MQFVAVIGQKYRTVVKKKGLLIITKNATFVLKKVTKTLK
jgi:hypothetical protein